MQRWKRAKLLKAAARRRPPTPPVSASRIARATALLAGHSFILIQIYENLEPRNEAPWWDMFGLAMVLGCIGAAYYTLTDAPAARRRLAEVLALVLFGGIVLAYSAGYTGAL